MSLKVAMVMLQYITIIIHHHHIVLWHLVTLIAEAASEFTP